MIDNQMLINDKEKKESIKGDLIISLLTLITIMLLSVFYNNKAVDEITFGIFIIYLVQLAVKRTDFFAKYFYIIFFIVFNASGVFIIEHFSLFLVEIRTKSGFAGSLNTLLLFHSLFIFSLLLFDKYFEKKARKFSDTHINVYYKGLNIKKIFYVFLMLFLFFVTIVMLIKGFSHPFYVDKIDRFVYFKKYITGYWMDIYRSLTYLAPILGSFWLYNKSSKNKICIAFLIFGYIICLFLIGVKFGSFLKFFYMLLLPFSYVLKKYTKAKRIKVLVSLVLCTCMLVSFVFIQRSLIYNKSFSKTFNYLGARVAQQGQLWWAIYKQEKDNGMHLNEIGDETRIFFNSNNTAKEEHNFGIYKIMRKVTPIEVFNKKIASGSRYSGATPAYLYYYFKSIGFYGFAIIGAIIYSFFINMYMFSLREFHWIEAIIYMRLFIRVSMAYTQADFYLIFSYTTLFAVLALMMMTVYRLNMVKKKIVMQTVVD